MKKPSLNHVYRLIWNTQLHSFVPVAETTAACGKRASRASALCVGALLSITPLAQALDPGALPTDGQVVAGSANIAQTANQMTVTQHTDRMVAQWSSFNIGEQAQVQFQQPNAASIALNRVINSNPSEILGSLSANGQVYLINPNGILFGRTAQVNVGGIVASTLDMSDADFLNANRTLSFTGNNGRVENLGALNATSVIALIAPEASNSGTLKVDNGSALIAAGNQVNLDFSGDGLVTVKVNQAAFNALAENKGLIQADGGLVMMTAQSANALMDTVVNHEGLIQANTLVNKNGRIILEGGDTGVTHLTGEINATGNTGGDVIVTGNKVGLFNDAHINVNGQFGGGNIFIGGGQEGADPSIHNAKAVHISQDSILSADATEFGKGGTLIAYSTDSTQVHGHLSARGGSDGGDGGFIETSGGWLDISKAPNTSSALGNPGTWLIDPHNITIASGSGNSNIPTTSPFNTTGTPASLGVDLINTALNSGNVSIQTGTGGVQKGDIIWNASLDYTYTGASSRSLTLIANRSIILNSTIASSAGALSLVFTANNNSSYVGGVIVKKNLTTNGGSITFDGVGTVFSGSTAQTLSTSGGAIDFNGEVLLSNTSGVTLSTNGGNIGFDSSVNSGNSYSYDTTLRTWAEARTALGRGDGDATGDTYLATITSAMELVAANSATAPSNYGTFIWLGGYREPGQWIWRWVTGPEGLENFGDGRPFFTQNSIGSGGSAYNGAYSFWSGGEPNNGATPEEIYLANNYSVAGEWLDVNSGYSLGSIVETNLAASPLTISAGTGTVTFSSTVGSTKALAALAVTGDTIALNGNVTASSVALTGGNGGTVSGNGNITASTLLLNGTGATYTLNTASANSITTIAAANAASINFKNSGSLTVGTVSSTNGVSATGAVTLEASGTGASLTLSQPVTSTSGNMMLIASHDIIWNTAYTYSESVNRSLTLQSARNIFLNESIESTSAALAMIFTADSDSNYTGGVVVKKNLATYGGNLTFNGAGTIFSGSSAQTVSTAGGAIAFNGPVLLSNINGLTLSTSNGNVSFSNIINSGNSYAYNSTTGSWASRRTAVASGTGSATGDTYLATVTSALEMTAVHAIAPAANTWAWLGGQRTPDNLTVWYWITGPEGLENSGAGRPFYTTGVGAYNGSYSNWAGGEPNGSGINGEQYLATGYLSTDVWIDVDSGYSLGSIVETNLANSPLTINANSGSVTISGILGGAKALSNLSISADTINTNTLNTTGTYTVVRPSELLRAAAISSAKSELNASGVLSTVSAPRSTQNTVKADNTTAPSAHISTGSGANLLTSINHSNLLTTTAIQGNQLILNLKSIGGKTEAVQINVNKEGKLVINVPDALFSTLDQTQLIQLGIEAAKNNLGVEMDPSQVVVEKNEGVTEL